MQIFTGAAIFDGVRLIHDAALMVEDGVVAGVTAQAEVPDGERISLSGGILAPGMIDLQVNGGGGIMVDGQADVLSLAAICAAHAHLGATGILPTLITDTPAATERVIAAGIAAAREAAPGFLGLHLEGPHLDPRRKGAHDSALIRPMEEADLNRLCDAAKRLPSLMITVAPEALTIAQISALRDSGAVVSLGHSDCSTNSARAAIEAGATCVTHLFNAMSQLGNREPGLVGTVLDTSISAGLIADGIHVAPEAMRIALAARRGGIFLVSDAMSVAGTDMTEFRLGGRRILRRDGRLTLEDGTLAGADLSLPQAVSVLVGIGIPAERALAMATSVPAGVMGLGNKVGHLGPGRVADMIHIDAGWSMDSVWLAGERVIPASQIV
ncbi:MAG: N-acetylglucosamine-6-phosphate deacetylase [Cereibacter sphaeroides]|uniref:N-acetylglucosamine-6-phosphate deacetylase n=1 Tax=Cereibacter sphaeroides TaxID=1063 RepID=A0A2W5SEB4_CERSP|nr:MAG: N-acetylglucosamine-6-phosphate deacetylase [Cereibacter sphaeroides]